MAAFEKIVNVQHAWPGSSRANLPPNMRHTHASHQNHNYNETYHLTGDGVVVPVVRHLAEHIFEPILLSEMSAAKVAA
jgi:hypothetical protein